MITGAYIENVAPSSIAANSDNSLTPFQIITQANYFIVERILVNSDNTIQADPNSTIYIKFVSSNRELSNVPFSINLFLGSGLKNKNDKALLIIPPNENINIVIYNNESSPIVYGIEFFGYYVNENGLKCIDGQAIDQSLINKFL